MKHRILTLLFLSVLPLTIVAQIVKPGEDFTSVNLFDGKVVFLKEIQLKDALAEKNYRLLKDWVKSEYAADPFNSAVNFDDKNKRATAVSRVEFNLPEKAGGTKEKIFMKYRLDAFIKGDLCIMEITNVNYINNPKENKNTLRDKISAKDMISDTAMQLEDTNKQTREETRKNTLYFLNEMVKDLQRKLND